MERYPRYPLWPEMGYPPQTWDGVPPRPGMGYPPDLRWGTPQTWDGVLPQTWDGVPPRPEMGYPPQTWDWVPPRPGTRYPPQPRQISIASTCYAAGGMPLAFTQEDFLVIYKYCLDFWQGKSELERLKQLIILHWYLFFRLFVDFELAE